MAYLDRDHYVKMVGLEPTDGTMATRNDPPVKSLPEHDRHGDRYEKHPCSKCGRTIAHRTRRVVRLICKNCKAPNEVEPGA